MKKKRKVRKSFLAVMAVFIIAVCIILSVTVLFPINDISVDYKGTKYTAQEIVKTSGVALGDNIIMLNTTSVKEKTEKVLPYVKNIEVKRQFPDKVVLKVTEGRDTYCIKSNKNYIITDDKLKVLSVNSKPNTKLVCINSVTNEVETGERVTFKKESQYQLFCEINKKTEKRIINYIDFSDTSNIVFYLDKKYKINLGTQNALAEKLDFLKKMLSDIESKNAKSTGTVNLQYYESKKEGYFSREDINLTYFE